MKELMVNATLSPSIDSPNNNPLVSVIICNYNYGRFLSQAIDSVLQQTYKNIELIVVDDGSTDNSRQVIESYGNSLIPIFQGKLGRTVAFNTTFERSTGEIICFLDADDYFHPEKVAKVVAGFQEHPQWVQISHCWTTVDAQGLTTGSGSSVLNQGDVSSLLLQWGKFASGITSAFACRREVLQKVLPAVADYGIDSYLNASLPFYGEVGCINQQLMFYRIHGKNTRAHSDNLSYMLQQRQAISNFINQTAAKVGRQERFDLEQDVDYLVLKVVQLGYVHWTKALQIIWLSLKESIAMKRSIKDTLIRVVSRGTCVVLPSQGKTVLRLGLRQYLRSKLSSQAMS